MTQGLTDAERQGALPMLLVNGWAMVDGRDAIAKTFRFRDFVQAFGFMTRCALVAEKLNHHPEWNNVYGKVDVVLTTHDCDGLSPLDLELAQRMDEFARSGTVA